MDGELLHDNDFENYNVEKGLLKLSANKLATMTFTIYDNNPRFTQINKLRSVITVLRDSTVVGLVRPVKSKMNFKGGVDYTCEDILARMNDVKRRPSYFSGTQAAYLEQLITDFNSQYNATYTIPDFDDYLPIKYGDRGGGVAEMQSSLMKLGYNLGSYGADGIFGNVTKSAVRAFQRDQSLTEDGIFDTEEYNALIAILTPAPSTVTPVTFSFGTAPASDGTTYEFINDEYVGYWDLIQENLIEKYGGYILPTYSNGAVSLSYVNDANLTQSTQAIVFGENLDNLFFETDSAETFSVLIPLGKDVRATGIHSGQAKNTPLTVKSVNGGLDYIEDSSMMALYGRREATMRWEDISSASALLTKGQAYLAENGAKLKDKITLSAYDLHYANINYDYLNFLDMVSVRSVLHGVEDTYPITEMQVSLNSPMASKLSIGHEEMTLTDRITGNMKTAAKTYAGLNTRVFDLENS